MTRLIRLDRRLYGGINELKCVNIQCKYRVKFECKSTPEGLAAFNDWEMRPSTFVSSYIHTPPEGFGKVMSAVKPRMAVAFHTVLLPDIHQSMLEGIRKTYDGPQKCYFNTPSPDIEYFRPPVE